MYSGRIRVPESTGGIDLQSTLESAQSFLWRRVDGELYDGTSPDGGESWYYTVAGNDVVFVRQHSGHLEWRATTDATEFLRRRLRLDDDLPGIFADFPADATLERARRRYPGLRVISDPFFPCLVSFICSARTPVERIHALQCDLAREFGDTVTSDAGTYHAYPSPGQLAAVSEDELRSLGLGFRAPYVERTAAMVASGELAAAPFREMSYGEAHTELQSFPGVGPKIADCVSLFALGHLEAVPIDRWTRRLVERYYPEDARSSYEATGDAFRERFGDRAGYAQTYLYHFERP